MEPEVEVMDQSQIFLASLREMTPPCHEVQLSIPDGEKIQAERLTFRKWHLL